MKCGSAFFVYAVSELNIVTYTLRISNKKVGTTSMDISGLMEKYESDFRSDLQPGPPVGRNLYHEIETISTEIPRRRRIYEMSPRELYVGNECITHHFLKKKIRRIKYSYGVSLLFMKEN